MCFFSIIMGRHHWLLVTMISPQPNSLLLQPRGSVVRAEQWGNLLWLTGRCHYGGLLCQWWGAPSWHGGHRYGCGKQPHHFQRKHLPDSWRKYGGKPQPHITLITLLLSYGEQHPCHTNVSVVLWSTFSNRVGLMCQYKRQSNCIKRYVRCLHPTKTKWLTKYTLGIVCLFSTAMWLSM